MVFVAKRNERKRAQGLFTDEREGVYEASYDRVANLVNPEREGVSKGEFDAVTAVWMSKFKPKLAAAKAVKEQYSPEITAAMDTFIDESVAYCMENMTEEHRLAGERKLANYRAD